MVGVHKRQKSSRIRGSRTAGWGFRQSHKGHGNKGGVGMAGSGKRGDHKKQTALESDKKGRYFGGTGLTSRGSVRKHSLVVNLDDIKDNFFRKSGDKIDLSKHKILGDGEGFKAEITARAASPSAIKKMEKAGGKIILPVRKSDKAKKKEAEVVDTQKGTSDKRE